MGTGENYPGESGEIYSGDDIILRDVERMKYLTNMIESDPRFPALADPKST